MYNANPRHEDNSQKTEALILQHPLPVTAGSDTHRDEDVARSGLLSPREIKTSEDFIALLKSGEAKIIREGV